MIMLLTITSALLHKTPIRFIRAFTDAAKVSGPPLLLQYPLYGGLVGLLGYQAAKDIKPLQTLLAEGLVHGATEYTLPFLTFVGSLIISCSCRPVADTGRYRARSPSTRRWR